MFFFRSINNIEVANGALRNVNIGEMNKPIPKKSYDIIVAFCIYRGN